MTPSEARESLALPIVWVLQGKAIPIFQNTDRSSPGSRVEIRSLPGYGILAGLPITVGGNQWEKAVVPVLSDSRWDMNLPLNRALWKADPDQMVRLMGIELEKSFSRSGYGPITG